MNTNKMRRHNQTRKKDPLRGWRDLGMLEPASQGRTFETNEWPIQAAINRMTTNFARSLFIAPIQFPRVTLHSTWSAPVGGRRIYPADEGNIIRGTD